MNSLRYLLFTLFTLLMATTAWAQITGSGTSDDPYVLHTGADIDLLQTPSYTFEARTTDNTSRFKLVFSVNEGN